MSAGLMMNKKKIQSFDQFNFCFFLSLTFYNDTSQIYVTVHVENLIIFHNKKGVRVSIKSSIEVIIKNIKNSNNREFQLFIPYRIIPYFFDINNSEKWFSYFDRVNTFFSAENFTVFR